jgi:hypothetical protein
MEYLTGRILGVDAGIILTWILKKECGMISSVSEQGTRGRLAVVYVATDLLKP